MMTATNSSTSEPGYPIQPLPPLYKAPKLAPVILSFLVNNLGQSFNLIQITKGIKKDYQTVRNHCKWLVDKGYVKQAKKVGNAVYYETNITSIEDFKMLVGHNFHELGQTTKITDLALFEVEKQPLVAWLQGYASKPGRNARAKSRTDIIPFVFSELFRIALLAATEKPWTTQSRLDELKKQIDDVVDTFNRLLSIATQLAHNSNYWDARYITRFLVHDGNVLDPEELTNAIQAVRANYGVPDGFDD